MDVSCGVCGEDWDTYHLRHDAPPWVMALFMAGAGCESCEGVPESEEVRQSSRLKLGYDLIVSVPFEGHADVEAVVNGNVPKWERPDDQELWECSCCNIKLMWDIDWRQNNGQDLGHYFEKTPAIQQLWHWSEPEVEIEHTDDAGDQYCSNCWTTCYRCNEEMGSDALYWQRDDHHKNHGMHAECVLEAESEDHFEWVTGELSSIAWRHDKDIVGEVDIGLLISDLQWEPEATCPTDEEVLEWLGAAGHLVDDEPKGEET